MSTRVCACAQCTRLAVGLRAKGHRGIEQSPTRFNNTRARRVRTRRAEAPHRAARRGTRTSAPSSGCAWRSRGSEAPRPSCSASDMQRYDIHCVLRTACNVRHSSHDRLAAYKHAPVIRRKRRAVRHLARYAESLSTHVSEGAGACAAIKREVASTCICRDCWGCEEAEIQGSR